MIAMGFPSQGVESTYRNPMSKIQEFLNTYHKGHYKIYNLCEEERSYDHDKFENRGNFFIKKTKTKFKLKDFHSLTMNLHH